MSIIAGTREQRRRKLGIDSVGRVVWRDWEPENEYIRKIRIRNIDTRAQTIQYKLPIRKETFFMNYPDPVTLSSGMCFDLEVRFRPTHLIEIRDMIEVLIVGRGSYIIELECQTPFAQLEIAAQHDFAHVAAGRSASYLMPLKNIGNVSVEFYWELPAPFKVEPRTGVLTPGQSLQICFTFTPLEACALIAQAVCKMCDTDAHLASVRLSGIGKYPFIRSINKLKEIRLDFGRLLTSTTRSIEFSVENPSMVEAAFSIVKSSTIISSSGNENNSVSPNHGGSLSPFTITPNSGVIARGEVQKFKATFTPTLSGAMHLETFRIMALAGNTISVQLHGVAAAPVVRLSTRTINFGDVKMDSNMERSNARQRYFFIKNISEIPLDFYCMATSPGAIFVVEPTSGEIPANSSIRVKVEFSPIHPINYMKRLLILVKHADSLLYVDLFGSAYDNVIRPLPFGVKEVEAFFLRHEYGLGGAEPKDIFAITEALNNGRSYEEISHLLLTEEAELQHQQSKYSNSLKKRKGKLDLSYINLPFSVNAPFYMNVGVLLFRDENPESQRVTIYNKTNTLATAYWCIPSNSAFCVTPIQEDIPPLSSFTFTVMMLGNIISPLSDHFLECYVNYKQMRSFRLVEEGAFTPPHCFTLCCQRELKSDPAEAGTIVPLIKAPNSLVFPACRCGDTTHAILEIENCGGVAVMFNINIHVESIGSIETINYSEKLNPPIFSCNPISSIIPPHQRFPVLLSIQPINPAEFQGWVKITLNNSREDEIKVPLRGESFLPELIIGDSSMIVLRPTCVTGEARRELKISNPTCFPITFDVFPSPEIITAVQVEPSSGIVGAGQEMELNIIFTPTEAGMYEGHLNFLISDSEKEQNMEEKKLLSCPCMGEGRYAVVEVEPVMMEYEGPALQTKTFEWTIYNSSICDISYEVRWLSKNNIKNWQEHELPPVQVNNKSGTLAARSHTVILVTLRPQAGISEFILYTLVGGAGTNSNLILSKIPEPNDLNEVRQHPHCEVWLKGTRPAVQITDVRSLQQYRSQLWCQLGINNINKILATPVQKNDVESDSFAFPQYVQGLEPIFMDLGVGSILHENKEILLYVENAGSCPASFRFWYPTEHEGGNETWFIEDEELQDIQNILSEGLMEISPKEGNIPVGSHKIITIKYRHHIIGTHSLPVLLRLDKGKKVLLMLEGRTVTLDANALAFHHPSMYHLHPVALGDLEPPLQTTIIENTASQDVEYIVQEDLLQKLAENNCGFPVFQCLNPTGIIPAGRSIQLNWYFRPLEARVYHIDVLIRTLEGEEYNIQFTGTGYHPKKILPDVACNIINDAFLPIPISPTLYFPLELCPISLSMDVMRIGAAPCFSLHRRICYIENKHHFHTYSFIWSTELYPGSSKLTVIPSSGVITPGQRIRCLLSLHCGSLSQILETSVFCHIRNETISTTNSRKPQVGESGLKKKIKLADGEKKSDDNNNEEYENEEDDDDETALNNDPLLDAKLPSKHGFQRTTCTKLQSLGSNKKSLPLTSISSEHQNLRIVTNTLGESYSAALRERNYEQGPVLEHSLEVLIQARVMSMESYEALFGKRAMRQMYFPTLWQNYVEPAGITTIDNIQKPPSIASKLYSHKEVGVALKVLDGLLRAVITKPQVRAAFTEPISEDIPYYREMVIFARPDSSALISGQTIPTTMSTTIAAINNNNDDNNNNNNNNNNIMKQSILSEGTQVTKRPFTSPQQGITGLSTSVMNKLGSNCMMRRVGPAVNMVEELLTDVTLSALSSVMEELRLTTKPNVKKMKN